MYVPNSFGDIEHQSRHFGDDTGEENMSILSALWKPTKTVPKAGWLVY